MTIVWEVGCPSPSASGGRPVRQRWTAIAVGVWGWLKAPRSQGILDALRCILKLIWALDEWFEMKSISVLRNQFTFFFTLFWCFISALTIFPYIKICTMTMMIVFLLFVFFWACTIYIVVVNTKVSGRWCKERRDCGRGHTCTGCPRKNAILPFSQYFFNSLINIKNDFLVEENDTV